MKNIFSGILDFILLKKSTIKLRLTVIFSALCVLAMGILLYITMHAYSRQMTEHIYTNELDSLKTASALLDSSIEKYTKLSLQLFANQKIRTLLSEEGMERSPAQKYKDLQEVKSVFTETIYNLSVHDITSIIICSKDGRIFSSYDLAGNVRSYKNEFYDAIISSERPYVIFPTRNYVHLRSHSRNTFAIGRLIRDDNLEEIGYILIFISLDCFHQSLSKSNLKDTTSYYVLSPQKQLMYEIENSEFADYRNTLLSEALSKANTSVASINKRQFLISKYCSDDSGWSIVSISDLSGITSTVHASVKHFIIIFCLISLMILFTAWVIAKGITHPLNDMQHVMADISSGNMSLRVTQYPSPDMNNLASQFNNMLDQIELLIAENNEKQRELIETELQMLRAQINPHFIYNTLNSISWLAVFNGQSQIRDQISNLTTLLRSAYSNPDQLITLANEKEILTCYTNIMQLRYDNFTLIFEDDSSVSDCLIPKSTLQPIVENCIIHGFPELNHPCMIKISFEKEAQERILAITVEDNGIGMSKETQEKCLDYKVSTPHFNNIGIRNVDQRIKLKFGSSYGLSIFSEKNKGTRVTIRVPVIRLESEQKYD